MDQYRQFDRCSRCHHRRALLPNGKVLAIAGYTGAESSSVEVYDPITGAWTNTTSLPYATDSVGAITLTNGTVLVCGGSDGMGGNLTNSAIYNPANQTWTNGALNFARAIPPIILLQNGEVLAFGEYFGYNSKFTTPIQDNGL